MRGCAVVDQSKVELLPCPFCGQSDFLVERLDNSSSMVICQGMVSEYAACLAQGPVGIQDDDGEDQPGKAAAIREWNCRATRSAQAEHEFTRAVAAEIGPSAYERLLTEPAATQAEPDLIVRCRNRNGEVLPVEEMDTSTWFDSLPNGTVVELFRRPAQASPQQAQADLVEALRTEALRLCDAIENINDLPPVKYALQAGRAVNKVRDAAAALSAQGGVDV